MTDRDAALYYLYRQHLTAEPRPESRDASGVVPVADVSGGAALFRADVLDAR